MRYGFFKLRDRYLQEDGFYRDGPDRILFWPSRHEAGVALTADEAEAIVEGVLRIRKAWARRFRKVYWSGLLLTAGLLGLIWLVSAHTNERSNASLNDYALFFALAAASLWAVLELTKRIVVPWRVSRFRHTSSAHYRARDKTEDIGERPPPFRLRPSVTGNSNRPKLARNVRLVCGNVLAFLGFALYVVFPMAAHAPLLLAMAFGLSSLLLVVAWHLAVPELRPESPPKTSATSADRVPRSDLRVLFDAATIGPLIGTGRLLGGVGIAVIGAAIVLIDRANDPDLAESDLRETYCQFIGNVSCADVPETVVIDRWQEVPTLVFQRGDSLTQAQTEAWEYSIQRTVRTVFRAARYAHSVPEETTVLNPTAPYILVRFFEGPSPASPAYSVELRRRQNGDRASIAVALDLTVFEEQLLTIAQGARSRQTLRKHRRTLLSDALSEMLGLDMAWGPEEEGVYVGGSHARTRDLIYRIHHDPLLVPGVAFNDQRKAFNAIVDKIYADPEGWLD